MKLHIYAQFCGIFAPDDPVYLLFMFDGIGAIWRKPVLTYAITMVIRYNHGHHCICTYIDGLWVIEWNPTTIAFDFSCTLQIRETDWPEGLTELLPCCHASEQGETRTDGDERNAAERRVEGIVYVTNKYLNDWPSVTITATRLDIAICKHR